MPPSGIKAYVQTKHLYIKMNIQYCYCFQEKQTVSHFKNPSPDYHTAIVESGAKSNKRSSYSHVQRWPHCLWDLFPQNSWKGSTLHKMPKKLSTRNCRISSILKLTLPNSVSNAGYQLHLLGRTDHDKEVKKPRMAGKHSLLPERYGETEKENGERECGLCT